MKAIVIREFGGPEVMSWEDIPTPTPGPGEVLVKVCAVSVNRTLDLDLRAGLGNYGTTLPRILGVDPSGEVVEVGSGVARLKVDQRVVAYGGVRCGECQWCLQYDYLQCVQPRMLGVQSWGGYAEYLCLPAHNGSPSRMPCSFPKRRWWRGTFLWPLGKYTWLMLKKASGHWLWALLVASVAASFRYSRLCKYRSSLLLGAMVGWRRPFLWGLTAG